MTAIAVIYRDAMLVPISGAVSATENWAAAVTISWTSGAARRIVCLDVAGVFATAGQALWAAEAKGRQHVDARLG